MEITFFLFTSTGLYHTLDKLDTDYERNHSNEHLFKTDQARLKRTPRVHLPFFIPISLLSITRTSLSHKEVTVHVPQMVLYFKGKELLGRIFNSGLLQSDP